MNRFSLLMNIRAKQFVSFKLLKDNGDSTLLFTKEGNEIQSSQTTSCGSHSKLLTTLRLKLNTVTTDLEINFYG